MVADADDDTLGSLSVAQLKALLAKADTTLAEGRALRDRIVRAMRDRLDNPIWPDEQSRKRP